MSAKWDTALTDVIKPFFCLYPIDDLLPIKTLAFLAFYLQAFSCFWLFLLLNHHCPLLLESPSYLYTFNLTPYFFQNVFSYTATCVWILFDPSLHDDNQTLDQFSHLFSFSPLLLFLLWKPVVLKFLFSELILKNWGLQRALAYIGYIY